MPYGAMQIRHIGLFTTDLERHAQFYEDVWGLTPVAASGETVFLRGRSAEPFLLSLHRGQRRGIHHIAFGMVSRDDVDRAAGALSASGVKIVEAPRSIEEPGGGYGFRFIDPDGRCIELTAASIGKRDGIPERNVRPSSICHVVLNTPDIDRSVDFYTRVLGFRISDWSEHQMVFLRCNSKHHMISFNQAPYASVNHVAYLVSGVDELMQGVANLRKSGVEPAWGPGRHGPGNNVFCYFKDPLGYVAEYTCDIDIIADEAAHQPQVWQRTPEAIDRWGLAGHPGPVVREAMAGEPDPGWMTLTKG